MDMLDSLGDGVDIPTQEILLAASNHDIRKLRDLLRNTSATVQDPETGYTPLHAAIAACEAEEAHVNGDHAGGHNADEERAKELQAAAETVRYLIRNGAVWDQVDGNDETPGCLARRLCLEEIYQIVVDAGVRSELLRSRLDEYQPLEDEEDEEVLEQAQRETSASSISEDIHTDSQTDLRNNATPTSSTPPDASQAETMATWQRPIMEVHAARLLPTEGLIVLNVGHGTGLIDSLFQAKKPTSHHIIEAHPQTLGAMREQGWMEKPGVVVHQGCWQDILPKLISESEEVVFDAIFFNTPPDDYKPLRDFFSEWVMQLLDPQGRFGFLNAIGGDRQVIEMDVFEAGFDIEWEDIKRPDLNRTGRTEGAGHVYWALEVYRLPTCKLVG